MPNGKEGTEFDSSLYLGDFGHVQRGLSVVDPEAATYILIICFAACILL